MALEVNYFKTTTEDGTGTKYFIEVIEDTDGNIVEQLEFSSEQEFDQWIESARSEEGRYAAFVGLQSPYSSQTVSSPESIGGAVEPLPIGPGVNATPQQIQEYQSELSTLNICMGLGEEPEDPPVVDSGVTEESLEQTAQQARDSVAETFPESTLDPSPDLEKPDFEPKTSEKEIPVLQFPSGKPPAAGSRGQMGEPLDEEYPHVILAEADVALFGSNNTSIVLGRDRPGSLNTGYGHGLEPHTGAGAIDIVVGRMAPYPKRYMNSRDKPGFKEKLLVNPMFNQDIDDQGRVIMDAARIYVSQKADIDKYFNINTGDGTRGIGNIETKSAIGMKADAVRIIARSGGIKLVTQERGLGDSVFSAANVVKEPRGIDIIAGNEVKFLQPMVMGDNLRAFLVQILDAISNVVGTTADIESQLLSLSNTLMFHTHPQVGPANGVPTAFSPEVAAACVAIAAQGVSKTLFSVFAEKWDTNSLRTNYLERGSPRETSILSKFNNVN